MATIVLRAGKGSPLTNAEVDANFSNLNTELGTKLSGNQTITVSGDATGSGATAITLTLANSGATAGTYGSSTNIPQITVDAKGRITLVSNVAVSIPSGSLTFTGDVTGSGSTGSTTTLTLANSGVTAGTYTKITVDAKGRATVGASLASSDVTTALGYTPVNKAGDTLTGTLALTGVTGQNVGGRKTRQLFVSNGGGATGGFSLVGRFRPGTSWGSGAGIEIALSTTYYNNYPNRTVYTFGRDGVLRLTYANGYLRDNLRIKGPVTYAGQTDVYEIWTVVGAYQATQLAVQGYWDNDTVVAGAGDCFEPVASTTVTTTDPTGLVSATSIGFINLPTVSAIGTVTDGGYRLNVGGTLNSTGALTQAGNQVLHAGNYNSYALPLSGGTLTGTLYGANDGTISFNAGTSTASSYNYVMAAANDTGNKLVIFVNGSARSTDGGVNATTIRSDGGALNLGNVTYSTNLLGSAINANGNTVLHAGNYNSYSPTLTGTGASGTWGINVTGNATSSTRAIDDSLNIRIANPGGAAYNYSAGGVTGAIKIRLPAAAYNSSTMMRFTVCIYNYSAGTMRTFEIGGYNYVSGYWVNISATQTTQGGGDMTVRFGYDGTSQCVWIGETTTAWSYPQVYVRDFQGGFGSTSAALWATGWSISVVTAFDTVQDYVNAAQQLHSGNYSSYALPRTGGTLVTDSYIDFGPNSTWGATLRVGGNGHGGTGRASVATTNGNLHLDSALAGGGIYLNWYGGTAGTYFGNGASAQVGRVDGSGNATFSGSVTALGATLTGNLSFGSMTGTWITSSSMADAIGWNASYGVYIGSNTLGYSSYLRGNGTFTNNAGTYNLIHAGNISSYAMAAMANGTTIELNQTITSDYTVSSGKNALSVGPLTVNTGVTVTVPSGSVWTIV